MADNSIIFAAARKVIDDRQFNDAARVASLNGACAIFLASHDKAVIFSALRPMMDAGKFNVPGRTETVDAACEQFLTSAADPHGGWWDNVAAAATSVGGGVGAALQPAPVSAPAVEHGDDRWLPLFRHMASPVAAPDTVLEIARTFAAAAPRYGQDKTKARIAEFVAQCANESGGFTRFVENLHYSARRLTQIWPNRFPTLASAQPYAWDPSDPDREDVALANYTYGRRMGNERDGTSDNDGWDYRGMGMLQLTGFDNFKIYGEALGLDLVNHPELAADPGDSTLIALEFFKRAKVNEAVDRGDFREARHRTNGGYIGVNEVAGLRAKALRFLG